MCWTADMAWPLPSLVRACAVVCPSVTTTPHSMRPPLRDLPDAVRGAYPFLDRAAQARGAAYLNAEGGDVGMHGSHRSVVRHVVHYLAAAELDRDSGLDGPVLDVGSGVGALAAWMADSLGAELHLVDHDARLLAIATEAFPDTAVYADLDDVATEAFRLVTAMEVIEHLHAADHAEFVGRLYRGVAPGGLLVVSTPDESGYLGGWSGYAPHVGCLDPDGLRGLLREATGQPATVWRLEGDPFSLNITRRVGEPVVNRAWGWVSAHVPGLAVRLGGGAAKVAGTARTRASASVPVDVRAVPPEQGKGTGLLGVVRAPGADR